MSWWDRQLKNFFAGGVNVTSPADGELLMFNSTSGDWENVDHDDERLYPEPITNWSPSVTGDGSGISGLTVEYGVYLVRGRFVEYNTRFTFTTSTTDVNALSIPAPSGELSIDNVVGFASGRDASSGSTFGTGYYCRGETTGDKLVVGKDDGTNFGSSGGKYINAWGWYIKDAA